MRAVIAFSTPMRHLVDRVQHAVDAKADHALLAPRLQVDVAGALVEGVLPQPVDHLHHALVVGVELLVALAQLDQLLEAGRGRGLAGLLRRAHRLGQREELGGVAWMSSGLATTRRTLRRVALDLGDPAEMKGSPVAITTSAVPTCTGSTLWRSA